MREPPSMLHDLYHFPVKGLSPQRLRRAALFPGQPIGGDRLYAIENGPSGFDPQAPAHLPKQRFLMLMRNERLARLKSAFDTDTHVLSIAFEGREVARGNLRSPAGRAVVERFLSDYCADELRGAPKVLTAPGHSFSDVSRKVVSIVNLASVRAIETVVGAEVDPLRFRANLYVTGWPAWHEFVLLGQTVKVGREAEIKIVKRIVRCAATDVDPQTGERDLSIPRSLTAAFGHGDCGVYGEVVTGGEIAVGDPIATAGA
jgi:MOSC domain-containing protein